MRTNVVLNDELLDEAAKYSTARSKSALIEEALRVFVQTRAIAARRLDYERRLRKIQLTLATVSPRESAVDVIRRDRDRS
jgi:Arc/MetJ family transcription regulator